MHEFKDNLAIYIIENKRMCSYAR